MVQLGLTWLRLQRRMMARAAERREGGGRGRREEVVCVWWVGEEGELELDERGLWAMMMRMAREGVMMRDDGTCSRGAPAGAG